jgi:hypothetical protein
MEQSPGYYPSSVFLLKLNSIVVQIAKTDFHHYPARARFLL